MIPIQPAVSNMLKFTLLYIPRGGYSESRLGSIVSRKTSNDSKYILPRHGPDQVERSDLVDGPDGDDDEMPARLPALLAGRTKAGLVLAGSIVITYRDG